jgi:integrase
VLAKITKRTVDGLLVPRGGRECVLWDSEIKGFGIRARRGGTKTYILHYRAGKGRAAPLRKITIGKHGSPWTPDTARIEAKRLMGQVAGGGDPCRDRAIEKKAMAFSELCDLYLVEGTAHKKPSTIRNDKARIEHHIKPLIGRKRVDAVTRGDIERLLVDVKGGTSARRQTRSEKRRAGGLPKGGAGAAAQCVTLVSTILTFAVKRGLRQENPARGIKKPPVRKMERFLSDEEISRLSATLEAEAASSGNPYPSGAIRLLLLTGCRRGEILNLIWTHVDFEMQCLRLPDSKTGSKIVYLNKPALELLQHLPRIVGNPYVIAGSRAASPLYGLDKIWYRVRGAAGLSNVRLHDLRHSFASVGISGGLSLPLIGALLGHKHPTTTARYAHLSAHPIRVANEAVGARLAAAMAQKFNGERSQ